VAAETGADEVTQTGRKPKPRPPRNETRIIEGKRGTLHLTDLQGNILCKQSSLDQSRAVLFLTTAYHAGRLNPGDSGHPWCWDCFGGVEKVAPTHPDCVE
jgi:hypothetical protein